MAGSRKQLEVPESPPKLRLTISDSLRDLPIAGVWSRGPVYQPLDPDFLAQPRIPKAPPTPRLQIDKVNGSVRVIDSLDVRRQRSVPSADQGRAPPTQSQMANTLPQQRRSFAQFARERHYRLVALVIGFGAGIAVAMLLHGF